MIEIGSNLKELLEVLVLAPVVGLILLRIFS